MNPATVVYTYDDYLLLPNDGKRYEIIDGELAVTPAPSTEHQEISLRLEKALLQHIEQHNWGKLYHAPVDVVFSMTDVVQPDIVLVSKDRTHIITKKNIVAAPDVVVEILSETTENTDRTAKKAMYERFGVKEYWIVDPPARTVEVYRLQGNRFDEPRIFGGEEIIVSGVLPGVDVHVNQIL